MPAMKYFMPPVNHIGAGSLKMAIADMVRMGLRKALLVSDQGLSKIGMVAELVEHLGSKKITSVVFDEVQPNPTQRNVYAGLEVLKEHDCNFVISLGGGSPHDCAKAIALLATNGGEIRDYEGMDRSAKPALPLIAINTTAGTASEMTRFAIITDEERHVKMSIADRHVSPSMSVNDPALMVKLPASMTAQTGMDALTHAIEGYLSMLANPITDSTALTAIKLIAEFLPKAVENGEDLVAREKMAYAQYMAGMTFNNSGLGYVHAMSHTLGGKYDLPHGLCNGVMLPYVMEFNAPMRLGKMADIARALGADTDGLTPVEAAAKAVESVRTLSESIGIPAGLKALNVREEDLEELAKKAKRDSAGITNPRPGKVQDILAIYQSALQK
ncbi:MAG: iron-containing alcohol dehydrogenase [Endozoicomonas sp.]